MANDGITPQSPGNPRPANRLASEASPYLLQHAQNPVEWWPWGEPAFTEARRRNVPILLSVGYSTCYWCHVMERECFEKEPIAQVMNRNYVCIKLDREERPDVDELYMNALVMTRGHGGWPMNAFLEPATLRPFWIGTYFPPEPRQGMPSWTQVLGSIAEAWSKDRNGVMEQSRRIADAVREHMTAHAGEARVGAAQVEDALSQLLRAFDRVDGGFSKAPKFPQPVIIEFLLDARSLIEAGPTRDAVDESIRVTLDRMAMGGLSDQVGGGFHRYSVDGTWTVPHFEKMLYDNAMLLGVYARAAELYAEPEYARIARRTAGYLIREMQHPQGAFYSAQDAEVRGREGLNYLWTSDEVRAALPADDAEFACSIYGLDTGPNFQDPHHPDEPPRNVLRLNDLPSKLAPEFRMTPAAILERLDRVNAGLVLARAKREQPRLDDKVITAWNGLAIAGLAAAARSLKSTDLLAPAIAASEFIEKNAVLSNGNLLRSWRDGRPGPEGVLEDYSMLTCGLLELAKSLHAFGRAEESELFRARADRIAARARDLFCEQTTGRWFDTRENQRDLFVRASSTHDGALPSAVSVMLNNLVALTESDLARAANAWHEQALFGLMQALSSFIAMSPVACINSCRALTRLLRNPAVGGGSISNGNTVSREPLAAAEPFLPVAVYADQERLTVGLDTPAAMRVVLRIADGYHVAAADPTPPGGFGDTTTSLVPLRIDVRGGRGVRVYADYPKGELYQPEGAPVGMMAHRGEIEFQIAVERDGDWSGRPMIVMTYQACTDTECLAPRTVELDVALDPA